jgi:hypothetical protein
MLWAHRVLFPIEEGEKDVAPLYQIIADRIGRSNTACRIKVFHIKHNVRKGAISLEDALAAKRLPLQEPKRLREKAAEKKAVSPKRAPSKKKALSVPASKARKQAAAVASTLFALSRCSSSSIASSSSDEDDEDDEPSSERFLMSNPVPVVGIVAAYLIFVVKVGPEIMKDRKPLNIKPIITIYNLYQTLFNFLIVSRVSNIFYYIFTSLVDIRDVKFLFFYLTTPEYDHIVLCLQ